MIVDVVVVDSGVVGVVVVVGTSSLDHFSVMTTGHWLLFCCK